MNRLFGLRRAPLVAGSCGRRPKLRPSALYSDAGGDVAVRHMRGRASLTAEESTKVTEFPKPANPQDSS